MQMSTTSRPRMKSQSVIAKCQVEIIDLKGTYVRSAGTKSAAILDGTELCRVEEFAARHFRRSGFEVMFLESAFNVLFGVYFWPVVQDRCDRRGPNRRYFGSPCLRSAATQRGDMDTTSVRLWDCRLRTSAGQGHHQASVSHRRNERRAAWTV